MFKREHGTATIRELKDKVKLGTQAVEADVASFKIDTVEKCFAFTTGKGRTLEVPLNERGRVVLSDFLQVPPKFVERQDDEFQNVILNGLLERRRHGDVVVRYSARHGLGGIYSTGQTVIDPADVVRTVDKIIGPDAIATAYSINPKRFELEVVVPDSHKLARLGDKRVGDITRGGLLFGLDIAHNLAPTVRPFAERLVCTNGMTMPAHGLQITSKGNTLPEILEDLELKAREAFGRVESQVRAFYDLRNEPVKDPRALLMRIAQEAGLSDRLAMKMVQRLDELPEDEEITMFTIINIVTNEANNPKVKPALARRLQSVGGTAIADHAARCNKCLARI